MNLKFIDIKTFKTQNIVQYLGIKLFLIFCENLKFLLSLILEFQLHFMKSSFTLNFTAFIQ